GMSRIDGAGELAGREGTVIEVGRRGMGVDEQRAVQRVDGVDIVDVLAVTDRRIHIPTKDVELRADIVLIIVFLDGFQGTETERRRNQFARISVVAGRAREDDLAPGIQTGTCGARRHRTRNSRSGITSRRSAYRVEARQIAIRIGGRARLAGTRPREDAVRY